MMAKPVGEVDPREEEIVELGDELVVEDGEIDPKGVEFGGRLNGDEVVGSVGETVSRGVEIVVLGGGLVVEDGEVDPREEEIIMLGSEPVVEDGEVIAGRVDVVVRLSDETL